MIPPRKCTLSRILLLVPALLLSGCGVQQHPTTAIPDLGSGIHGMAHGGQQSISGATIQLYAVGTASDGSAATALLTTTVTTSDGTGIGGNASNNFNAYTPGVFNITGDYTCPTPTTLVYITATGGNPGMTLGTNNTSIAILAALGQCQTLATTPFISIDEVTTVGAIAALAPYVTSFSAIGSATSDASALSTAFTLASEYVNIATGTSPGTNVPAGMAVPTTQINTLANILSSCVNSSGGTAGDTSNCGYLYTYSTPSGGTAPTNVLNAILDITNNPTNNIQSLLGLASANAPFQPALTIPPPNWGVALGSTTPAITPSPSSLTFPATTLNFTSAPQTITFTNTSSSAIYGDLNFTGADPGDFAIAVPNSSDCPSPTPSGGTCTISVSFTPTATGTRYADLAFGMDTTSAFASYTGSVYVPLSGTGVADTNSGPITLTPSGPLSFTQYGMPQTLTLTNYGTTPLNIASISISSTSAAWFSQTNNCGTVLAAQSICNIYVSAVVLNSTLSGTLTIIDDATSNNIQTVSLSSSSPTVQATGNPINFGSVAVGGTSGASITAYSINSPSHSAPGISCSISGPNASDFLCEGTSGVSVASTLFLAFQPTGVGTRTATLSTGYGNIALSGTSYNFTVSAPSSFSNINVGSSTSLTYTITNAGTSTLSLTSALTGPASSNYSINNMCGSTLAASASCQAIITFTPSTSGTRNATWTVTDTTSGYQIATPLAGIGQLFTVTPQSSFNTIEVDSSDSVIYVIANVGTSALSLSSGLSGSAASNYAVSNSISSPCGASLPIGQSCQMILTFTPTETGTRNATWTLTDSTSGFQVATALSGSGMETAPSLSPSQVLFTNIPLGTTSMSTATISSAAGHPVTFTFNIYTGSAANFTFSPASSCSSTPCNVTIYYSPTAVTNDNGYLSITDTETGAFTSSPYVAGTGGAPIVGLSPTSLTFPLRAHGTTSIAQSVTLTNSGNRALTISSIGITGTNYGDFSLQSNTCGTSLAPSASCSLSVSYAPVAAGSSSANLQIVSNASSSPDSVSLSGTAN